MGILVLLAQSAVWASSAENPFVLPMGEQEALLGNTGIAMEGSPANPIYNPAGLVSLEDQRLSVSGSTYALVNAKFDNPSFKDPLSFKNFTSVPNMISGSKRINKWTLGYGIYSPIAVEIDAKFKAQITGFAEPIDLTTFTRTEEQYLGFASARDTGNGWSLGLGLFAHRYSELNLSSLQYAPAAGTLSVSETERLDQQTYSILAILGAQKRFSRDFICGFRIGLPSYQVYSNATVFDESVINNSGTITKTTNEGDRKAQYQVPLDTGMGMAVKFSSGHTLFWDLSVVWPNHYQSIVDDKVGKNVVMGTTMRTSLGYKYRYRDDFYAMAGLIWNPSNIRSSVNGKGNSDAPQNYLGGTGGFYYISGNLRSGLGLFAIHSRTDRKFFGAEPDDRTSIDVYGMTLSASLRY